jgi:hypothetical protein
LHKKRIRQDVSRLYMLLIIDFECCELNFGFNKSNRPK